MTVYAPLDSKRGILLGGHMARILILFTLLISAFLATGCNGETVKEITLFKKGTPHGVDNKETLSAIGHQAIISAQGIDDVMQVILQPSQISEIIKKEDGVEIIFEDEQQIYRANNKHPINFTRLYIPLSGKYSKLGMVFFFGDTEGYGGMPPYVNTIGIEGFKKSMEIIQ